jgi:hypothetical protein
MNTGKTKILALFLFVFVFTSFSNAQFKSEPKAVVKPMAFDFGTIIQDSVVTTYFMITNKGTDILKIKKVSASCGCTAAVSEKNELKQSESTEIKVTFDSKGKSGKQAKSVYIETNDPKNPTITLALTGNIVEKGKSVEGNK